MKFRFCLALLAVISLLIFNELNTIKAAEVNNSMETVKQECLLTKYCQKRINGLTDYRRAYNILELECENIENFANLNKIEGQNCSACIGYYEKEK